MNPTQPDRSLRYGTGAAARRLGRVFQSDGRAVIVALDHGLIDGPCPGFENPSATIAAVVAGGADAILTSFGIAKSHAQQLDRVGLILRSDGAATNIGTPSDGSTTVFFSVEDALRLAADALVVTALPGSDKEAASLENLSTVVAEAHRWGMPVLAEMVPGGFDGPSEGRSVDTIAAAARLGAELGADFIKAPYHPGYEQVTQKTFAPVVILGGSKKGSSREMLADIHASLQAGGAGVAIGRNIFQAPDPRAMTEAIVAVAHHGASVDDAMDMLPPGS